MGGPERLDTVAALVRGEGEGGGGGAGCAGGPDPPKCMMLKTCDCGPVLEETEF
jgi:hypothetical protein